MVVAFLLIAWLSACASFFCYIATACDGGRSVDYDRTGFLSDRGIRKRIALEEKKKKEQDEMEGKKNDEEPREEQVKKEEQESKVGWREIKNGECMG